MCVENTIKPDVLISFCSFYVCVFFKSPIRWLCLHNARPLLTVDLHIELFILRNLLLLINRFGYLEQIRCHLVDKFKSMSAKNKKQFKNGTNRYSVIEILRNFVTTLNWWSDLDKAFPPLGSFIQVSLSEVTWSENPLCPETTAIKTVPVFSDLLLASRMQLV